jgi:hypothetical protein
MCRTGGRRCPGSGGRGGGGSPASSAGGQGGSRRFDGKPETEADKRFFNLRESGYTGPINQDGNATNRHVGILDALRAAS